MRPIVRGHGALPHLTRRVSDVSDESDENLISRFRSGDKSAFNAIRTRYEIPLQRFLYGILGQQADEALQTTYSHALEHLDGVDGDHLRGWLFTVAYDQALLVKRKAL